MAAETVKQSNQYQAIQKSFRLIMGYARDDNMRPQIFNVMGSIISNVKELKFSIDSLLSIKESYRQLHEMYLAKREAGEDLIDVKKRQNSVLQDFNKETIKVLNGDSKIVLDDFMKEFLHKVLNQIVNPSIPMDVHNGMRLLVNKLKEKTDIDARGLEDQMGGYIRLFASNKEDPQLVSVKGAFLDELKSKLNLDDNFNPK